MGKLDSVNVPDRVEPACRPDRLKLIVSIMLACIKPAPAITRAHGRNSFILFDIFPSNCSLTSRKLCGSDLNVIAWKIPRRTLVKIRVLSQDVAVVSASKAWFQ